MAKDDTRPRPAAHVGPEDVPAADNIRAFLEDASDDTKGWGESLRRTGLTLISATDKPTGKVVYEYVCDQSHTNRLGNLHGGCAATIFDFCTTTALFPLARPGFWQMAGVSRTLNVTYLRPVPVGETVVIECEVVAVGKRLATVTGTMKRKADGALMCMCEHGKVNIDPKL